MCFLQYFTQFIHILMAEINRCLNPIHPITSLKRINYKKHMLLSFPKQNRESSYFALRTENIEKIKQMPDEIDLWAGNQDIPCPIELVCWIGELNLTVASVVTLWQWRCTILQTHFPTPWSFRPTKTIKFSTVYINLPFDKSPVLLTTVSILVNIQHHYECGIQSPNMPLSEC